MIFCQHKNKDREEARMSKPDIFSLDGISCLVYIITPKSDDTAFFVYKKRQGS